jgi:hypothetical protein
MDRVMVQRNRVQSVADKSTADLNWVGQLRHDLAGVTNALQTLLGSDLGMDAPARQILELSVERLNLKLSELDKRRQEQSQP